MPDSRHRLERSTLTPPRSPSHCRFEFIDSFVPRRAERRPPSVACWSKSRSLISSEEAIRPSCQLIPCRCIGAMIKLKLLGIEPGKEFDPEVRERAPPHGAATATCTVASLTRSADGRSASASRDASRPRRGRRCSLWAPCPEARQTVLNLFCVSGINASRRINFRARAASVSGRPGGGGPQDVEQSLVLRSRFVPPR